MFEDSTFESNGRIRTRSRGWMFASFAFNASILTALVLIPILYPQALPRAFISRLMILTAPSAPEQPRPHPRPMNAVVVKPEMRLGQFFAPRYIPAQIVMVDRPEVLPEVNVTTWGDDPTGAGNSLSLFRGQPVRPVVRPDPTTRVRIPSTVVAGLLLQKSLPVYPPIARATGTQGTVALAATISRTGTIENLRVVSGPMMLQQAALDAVKSWRYRPDLLGGAPVEVETTINVVFTLQ